MSVDGHIADGGRSPTRLGSDADRRHLDGRLAQADAVLVGAATLRAVGRSMLVQDEELRAARRGRGLPDQPIQIVASRSGVIDADLEFFREPVVRWLATTTEGSRPWTASGAFDDVIPVADRDEVHWPEVMAELRARGVARLCVAGGGDLVAGIVVADLVDDIWLTVCPVLIGGERAPTPIDGPNHPLGAMPPVALVSAEQLEEEVFLHYRIR